MARVYENKKSMKWLVGLRETSIEHGFQKLAENFNLKGQTTNYC